jgi:hypothetical protein
MVKYPNFGSTSGLYGTTRAPSIIGNEEPTVIQSEKLKTILVTGIKYIYSGGIALSGNSSGYNFYSGESDIEPPNASGWGQIRIPELSTVHSAIIIPRMQCKAYVGYPASGVGGASGNVVLCQWLDNSIGTSGGLLSGVSTWFSGIFVSGLVDVWATGTK